MSDIVSIMEKQRDFFRKGGTIYIDYRKKQLRSLLSAIERHESEILAALHEDLNKSSFEGYITEVSIVKDEIKYTLKHLSKWARPKRVKTPITLFPGKSYRYREPYGITLVMAPWNYPFQLTLAPLVGSISGGNCTVLKPSNYSPATSAIIRKIMAECFSEEYVAVIEGGREANQTLLQQKFDYIFFTGGVTVGKLVMEAASKNLTPVSLELGGKSPCIVDKTADIDLTAKRIMWGKFVNAGQTCVAPDYILVETAVKDELMAAMKKWLVKFHGEKPLEDPELPKIITQKHFERLSALVDGKNVANGKVAFGGSRNPATRQIEPTLLDSPTPDSPVMSEEIFGPVMPVIPVCNMNEAIEYVLSRPKPLALYYFTRDKKSEKYVIANVPYGGGCINDTLIHLATPHMPFGGVGNSGMGHYHGKESFTSFTHEKSVLKRGAWPDVPLRYQPYGDKLKVAKLFM
ncbi:MAG: aldehyde dehydrogenase [Treponemataceae bacterium]|nr:aldehyde dehydrogenase [Treponemataceae bacterium]